MTTILLADDHQIVRQGMRALLEAEQGLTVVGEAADGLKAVELAERLKPAIAILDMMMPHLNGIEATRQMRSRAPQTRVIILSMHANEAYVLESLRNGAAAYVLKDASSADLLQAIQEVVAGRRYLSAPLSERAIEAYVHRISDAALDPYESLTSREREVLQLAAEGFGNGEIAARLQISPRTAEVHRANLLRKLNLHSQTELIRFAIKRGILSVD